MYGDHMSYARRILALSVDCMTPESGGERSAGHEPGSDAKESDAGAIESIESRSGTPFGIAF
tara:strand:+ start:375 stop:560 length:186 start_codon:yes stop_codon:yes gene_type:complete